FLHPSVIWFVAFIVLRLAAAGVFLLTWAYAVATYSPFAFEMFIRPQLFPWLTTFVTWHHVWYAAAYVGTVVTLLPDLAKRPAACRSARTTRWAAATYITAFGIIGAYLVTTPYLPTLWNDSRSLVAALVSLVPLMWLAVIDHLAAWEAGTTTGDFPAAVTGQRRLLISCVGAAGYIWGVHLLHALSRASTMAGVLPWMTTAAWALALDMTTFMIVYVLFSLAGTMAAATRAPRAWEH